MLQGSDNQTPANVEGDVPTRWESDHWTRLQDLFHLASSEPPGERTRILREACSDSLLVDRVLELLAASSDEAVPVVPFVEMVSLGTRVGPYALLRHLGTGGLGSVYLAERMVGGVPLRCALKVLSMHAAGPQFESRFQREQQILARLNDPHITRLLDAGFSETTQPYLVMEYVDGVDLVRYSDEHTLNIPERLKLFLQVCHAVAYAHRNLIVHLDIKPSNVLVSTEGEVKLLDFGTSKLIDPDNALTTTILATPAYAAPEQLRNEAVTTACDIYSLGAMLFELLTGQRPFQSASVAMVVERALKQQEPLPITTAVTERAAEVRGTSTVRLRQLLAGDLATIVARCLRSKPMDRYASVDALAEDLLRYLDGRPVLARPQTHTYRLGKFLRRNRAAVTAAAVVTFMMIAAGGYGYARQQQALREGERAERMQNFLYSILRLANTNYTGRPATTIADFLQLTVTALPEFIHDPADQRFARLSLAESMFDSSDYEHALPVLLAVQDSAEKAGDVAMKAEAMGFAGMTESELGHYDQASSLLDTAMSLRSGKGVSAGQRLWIVGFFVSNRYNNGVRSVADAELLNQTLQESEAGGIPDRERGWALGNLATLFSRVNQPENARRAAAAALTVLQRQPYTECDQAFTNTLLGDLDMNGGDDISALTHYQDGYQRIVRCKGPDDLNSLELEIPLARLLVKDQRGAEALTLLEPSVAVWRKLLPGNPEIGYALTTMAQAHIQLGHAAQAASLAQEALAAQTGKLKHNSMAMALTYQALAQARDAEGKFPEALASAREANAIFDALPTLSANGRRIQAENKAEIAGLLRRDTH